VSANEVEIQSIAEGDHSAVVVGHVKGRLHLLDVDEVTVNHLEKDATGQLPRVFIAKDSSAPMVVPQVTSEPTRDE
jgi:hypothetical protein